MSDDTAPHATRVSAASAILKFARESIELDELVARIDALEHATEQSRSRKKVDSRWT